MGWPMQWNRSVTKYPEAYPFKSSTFRRKYDFGKYCTVNPNDNRTTYRTSYVFIESYCQNTRLISTFVGWFPSCGGCAVRYRLEKLCYPDHILPASEIYCPRRKYVDLETCIPEIGSNGHNPTNTTTQVWGQFGHVHMIYIICSNMQTSNPSWGQRGNDVTIASKVTEIFTNGLKPQQQSIMNHNGGGSSNTRIRS